MAEKQQKMEDSNQIVALQVKEEEEITTFASCIGSCNVYVYY